MSWENRKKFMSTLTPEMEHIELPLESESLCDFCATSPRVILSRFTQGPKPKFLACLMTPTQMHPSPEAGEGWVLAEDRLWPGYPGLSKAQCSLGGPDRR